MRLTGCTCGQAITQRTCNITLVTSILSSEVAIVANITFSVGEVEMRLARRTRGQAITKYTGSITLVTSILSSEVAIVANITFSIS